MIAIDIARADGVPWPRRVHEQVVACTVRVLRRWRVVDGGVRVERHLHLPTHIMAVDYVVVRVGARGQEADATAACEIHTDTNDAIAVEIAAA